MHFVLGCAPARAIIAGPDADEAWGEGRLLELPPAAPLVFTLDPAASDQPASMYDGLFPLWSDALLRAVREAGVDNLQAFPAALQDARSGRPWSPYWAVNVVGLVAAVDLEGSGLPADGERGDLPPAVFVLDQKKAAPFRLFRLAESPDLVLVDEQVRRAIERRPDLGDVSFTRPGPEG
jgi:hypothetical protein